MKDTASQALQTTWALQAQWSKAADVAKKAYVGWGRVALVISILAAISATATTHVDADAWRRSLAAGSAVLVSILAVIGRRKTSPTGLRDWVRARSASEGLKTEAYQYLTRTGPYAQGDAAKILSERTRDITVATTDLNHLVAALPAAATPRLADSMTIDEYLEERVDSQISHYYAPRAAREARLVERYRALELALALVGAGLAAWASVVNGSRLAPWAAVITTTMAALASHLAAGRHEYQVTTYTATKVRLKQLSDRFRDATRTQPADAARVDQLVSECEAVISVENQGWMAQWEKPQA